MTVNWILSFKSSVYFFHSTEKVEPKLSSILSTVRKNCYHLFLLNRNNFIISVRMPNFLNIQQSDEIFVLCVVFFSDKLRVFNSRFLTDFLKYIIQNFCCFEFKFKSIFQRWLFPVKLWGFKSGIFG